MTSNLNFTQIIVKDCPQIEGVSNLEQSEAVIFEQRKYFLGNAAADPTVDLNGNDLTAGAFYYNSENSQWRYYNGSAWGLLAQPVLLNENNFSSNSSTFAPTQSSVKAYVDTKMQEISTGQATPSGQIMFKSVSAMLSNADVNYSGVSGVQTIVNTGDIIYTPRQSFEVVDNALSTRDVDTAGGLKLNIIRYGDTVNVAHYGAVGDGVADDLPQIQKALDSGASFVEVDEVHQLDGTLVMPEGVQIIGKRIAGAYYRNSSQGYAKKGSTFLKNSSSAAGPMVIVQTGCGVKGMFFDHDKDGGANDGIIRLGYSTKSCHNAEIHDCKFMGKRQDDQTGVNTCLAVHFPDGNVTAMAEDNGNGDIQRYGNTLENCMITDVDQGIFMGTNCNANLITGYKIRNFGVGIHLSGRGAGGGPLENVFNSGLMWVIGAATDGCDYVVKLGPHATLNRFDSFATEALGKFVSIDATALYNVFIGTSNESVDNSFTDPSPSAQNRYIDVTGDQ